MRNQFQFALHNFSNLETAPFSPEKYSRLKFGSDKVAKDFGYDLADGFFNKYHHDILNEKIVVIPSPYNQVKNASTIMSEHFMDRMNDLLVSNGGSNLEWSVINRKVSYINDYGFLDKEKRKALIDNDVFHLNKGFLEGKKLIFIDDVNITGTHEDKLIEILDKNEVKNDAYFLYYAKYSKGAVDANIEAALNFAGIRDARDYVALTAEKNHHLIVRPIKFLMSRDPAEFEKVIKDLDIEFIQKLYYGCLSEGYHKIKEYQINFKFLMWYLGKNK